MTKAIYKVPIASACGALFISSLGLLVQDINFIGGTSGTGLGFLWAFMVSSVACLILGWMNSRSLRQAFIGCGAVFLIGLPMVQLIFAPLTEEMIHTINPSHTGFISFFLDLGISIFLIEALTDNGLSQDRRRRLLLSTTTGVLILLLLESLPSFLGGSTATDFIRLIVYAALLWGGVVATVNYHQLNSSKHI